MALKIVKAGAEVQGTVADRPLYLTREKDRVVEEGDPEAAFTLVGCAGATIPASVMKELGLSVVDGRVVQVSAGVGGMAPAAETPPPKEPVVSPWPEGEPPPDARDAGSQ